MKSASVTYQTIVIPTFELLRDDLNPIFDKKLDPYPYTLQNYTSKTIENKQYVVVVLENEYLQLTIIPSLGGRLYSAIDKRNNREFLYRNTSVTPRMIGTRGAWFAGGIEFNFPISHAPTTMDRVNCQTIENEDGSASVIFGNIEQMSFMNWKVELKLSPGTAYIEQRVHLVNPTPFENKFYFWTNTAVEYNNSLRLVYPFDWCINFDEEYVKWPYYRGMDCRKPQEIPQAYETFGKLMTGNFFGVYNFEKDYGLVHYANRKKVKGAKFFIWGNDENARAWNKALSIDDSQYIEIQSGPFESQAVYKFMKPHQELDWTEFWYPIHGMNGFRHAEKELCINFEKNLTGLNIEIAATEPLPDCRMIIHIGGKVYEEKVDLSPERLTKVSIDIPGDFELHELKLDVYAKERHLVSIGERKEYTDEYPDPLLYEDSRVQLGLETEQNKLKKAMWEESLGQTGSAMRDYESYLRDNPTSVTALIRLGQLYLKSMRYDQATTCLTKALAHENRNGRARFLLAVTEKEQGHIEKSRRLFLDIAVDSEDYEASVLEVIKLDLLLGYYHEARMLCESLDSRSRYKAFLHSIACRKDGAIETAKQIASNHTVADEFLLAELFLQNPNEENRKRLMDFTDADERVLVPIALELIDIGCQAEAEKILTLIHRPTLRTRLALLCVQVQSWWTHSPSEEQSLMSYIQACLNGQSLDHVFLKERKLVQLIALCRESDSSGVMDYLLGVFYYSVAREDDALRCFSTAYHKGSRYTVLLYCLGYIHYRNQELRESLSFLEEDLRALSEVNPASIILLDKVYKEMGDGKRRKQLLSYMQKVINRPLVLIPWVELLMDEGMDDEALALFESEEFENWEGLEVSGVTYRQFILRMTERELQNGTAEHATHWLNRLEMYPENLHYGPSASTPCADILYYKGRIFAVLGQEEKALAEFRQGYQELYRSEISVTDTSKAFSMKCMEELNRRETLV